MWLWWHATASCLSLATTLSDTNQSYTSNSLRFWAHCSSTEHHVNVSINSLTPLLPHGYSCKASCAKTGKVCTFWHPGTLTIRPERQSARMSKITNYGLAQITVWRSGTHMATVDVKGFHTSLSIDPYTLQLLPEIFKHVKRCCHFCGNTNRIYTYSWNIFFGAQCIDEYWNKWYTYTCSRTYSSKFSPQTTSKTSFCVFSSAPEFIVLNPDPTKWWGGFKRCRCLSVRLSVANRAYVWGLYDKKAMLSQGNRAIPL